MKKCRHGLKGKCTKCRDIAHHAALRRDAKRWRQHGVAFSAAKRVVAVADELCEAIDLAAEDIGGARPIKEILADLGSAVNAYETGSALHEEWSSR